MINVKLKIWQKIIYYLLFICGLLVAGALPLYILLDKVVIEYWYIEKARFSFITLGAIAILGYGFYIPIKSWYNHKLQAIEVANELNAIGLTSPIFKWILRFLQFAIPVGIIITTTYAFSLIPIPHYKVFVPFIGYFVGGFVILVINDYIKIGFLQKNEVEQQVKLDRKKEKYITKKNYKLQKKKRTI